MDHMSASSAGAGWRRQIGTSGAATRRSDIEGGFTLVELLVVVLVLGALAGIAIPTMLNNRDKAYRSAIVSDMHNAATAEEAYATESDGKYTSFAADLYSQGFIPTDDVTVSPTVVSGGVCLVAWHAALGAGPGSRGDELWWTNQGNDAGAVREVRPAGC